MSSSGGAIESVSVVTPNNPAAGADWSFIVANPGALLAVRAVLTTSATVANRVPFVQVIDASGHFLYSVPVNAAMVASGVNVASAYPGAAWGNNQGTWTVPLASGLVVPANGSVAVATSALQAGDQWSNIVLTFADR